MYESMTLPIASPIQDLEHAVNRLTRPYQWLRREAISNLRIMQALGRPCMTRQVLCITPGQDEELLNESERGDADGREMGPTEKLARYYAACYVEITWHESQRALEMLMSWLGERTMEWVTDECARAGVTTKASEVEMGEPSAPRASIPRRKHGPREQESPLAPQTSPPTMDIHHECATEGCTTLVCSGGDRQHVQSPYCSDACWREHAKGGRAHGPADTKA
jgi:hypothetical protein